MDVVKQARLSEWAEDVKDWKKSGLTQQEWCKNHDISINTFRYRMRALKQAISEKQNEQNAMPVTFVPVKTTPQELAPLPSGNGECCSLTIEISGAKINIGSNADMQQLKNVIEVLRYVQ